MPADALRIRGRHNALNALAALALASAIGCPLAPMLHALREYRGEPHRVEHVATIDGVDAFDDSKGTNVGATVAALVGLGSERAPAKLVVILGGDGKGQDFAPLAAPLARHARAVRDDRPRRGGDRARRRADRRAVRALRDARGRGRAPRSRAPSRGDAVLLSPACASLDMFRNYAHRAEVFVAAVRRAGRRGARRELGMSAIAAGRRRCSRRRAMSAVFADAWQSWRERLAAPPQARRRTAPAAAAAPSPSRSRCANGSASSAASRRACSASTAPSSASSSPCSRSAW